MILGGGGQAQGLAHFEQGRLFLAKKPDEALRDALQTELPMTLSEGSTRFKQSALQGHQGLREILTEGFQGPQLFGPGDFPIPQAIHRQPPDDPVGGLEGGSPGERLPHEGKARDFEGNTGGGSVATS